MPVHLHREIDLLKKKVLTMSAMVQDTIAEAVQSLDQRQPKLADKVIEADNQIDQLELEIEEDCLKILALHSPVANDLRFVVAVLKINNDLERMADLAVNIAERSKHLAMEQKIAVPENLDTMANMVQQMLKKTLDALIQRDTKLAREVIEADDMIDNLNRQTFQLLPKRMCEYPETIGCLISLLSVSRNLERIADQITNIAEDIIYMVEGHLVRHSGQF